MQDIQNSYGSSLKSQNSVFSDLKNKTKKNQTSEIRNGAFGALPKARILYLYQIKMDNFLSVSKEYSLYVFTYSETGTKMNSF